MPTDYLITNDNCYITLSVENIQTMMMRGHCKECEPKKGYHLLAFTNIKFLSFNRTAVTDYTKEVVEILSNYYMQIIGDLINRNKDKVKLMEMANKFNNHLYLRMPKEENDNQRTKVWSWDSRFSGIKEQCLHQNCQFEVRIKQLSIMESRDKDGKYFIYPKFELDTSILVYNPEPIIKLENSSMYKNNDNINNNLPIDDDEYYELANTEPTSPQALLSIPSKNLLSSSSSSIYVDPSVKQVKRVKKN